MSSVRFRNNLKFALRKESAGQRKDIPLTQIESLGNTLSWLVYDFRYWLVKLSFDPRFITVIFTFCAMLLVSFIFYPLRAIEYTFDFFDWIVSHLNWGYVRFALWFLSEITILGLGMRAFGRFSNAELMKQYFAT